VATIRPAIHRVLFMGPPKRGLASDTLVGVSEAAGGYCTVKVTLPVLPMGVTTATLLAVFAAVEVMVKVAVTVVEFTTVTLVTVTPAPETVTPVAPVRFVPVSVTLTAVPCVPKTGLIEVRVGPNTVKGSVFEVPPGAVTVTLRVESVAAVVMAKLAVIVVSFTTVKLLAVTPVPETAIAVVPVRPVPVRVTATVVPLTPLPGETTLRVGAGGFTTVNVTAFVVPPGAVTVTLRAESVAAAVMTKLAVIVVSFTTVKVLTVTPVPATVMLVAPVRPAPVSVTAAVVPLTPLPGETALRVGASTVKVTELLVPPGVVTVTFRAVAPAVGAMTKVAVIVLSFTTVRLLTVTPAPETVMAVAPVRLVPLRVTGTGVARSPLCGVMEVSAGTGGFTTVNVTALVMAPPPFVTVTVRA